MPVVAVKLARRSEAVTRAQKAGLAAGMTDVICRVLDKRRDSVSVLIEDVDADNWAEVGEGGELVSVLRQPHLAAVGVPPEETP